MTASRANEWQARFDALAAAKTRAAIDAHLLPFRTVDAPKELERIAIGNAWSRRLFDGAFYISPPADNRRPVCSLVFVQSADGNTGADDPASLGGGATDTHLIYEGLSRVAADAVMAGAATVRGSGMVFTVWHPQMVALRAALGLARHPIQIVAANRGLDIAGELICNLPSIRVVLLTGASPPGDMKTALIERPWITHLPVRDGDLHAAFARLRDGGITRISCVGGRTLARALLEAHLVDEVYLTTAPNPGGEPATPIAPWPWRGPVILRKQGTDGESGVVFEHVLPRGRRD
jgi:riboflavin biosynthesis pyrimidine reductase